MAYDKTSDPFRYPETNTAPDLGEFPRADTAPPMDTTEWHAIGSPYDERMIRQARRMECIQAAVDNSNGNGFPARAVIADAQAFYNWVMAEEAKP